MKNSAQAKQGWRIAFVAYAVLGMSSMAGMSIGLGIFALATIWFFASSWKGEGRTWLGEAFATPFSWLSLALLVASFLSLAAAVAFPVEGSQAGPLFSSLKKYHYYVFPPLYAAALLHTADSPERHPFWKAWGIFGALLGVIATIQFFGAALFPASWLTSSFFRPVGDTGRFHGQGLMFFHLSFASSMCFMAASAWARLFFPLRGDSSREKAFWCLVAVLATMGVWFSYSRIAFAALGLILFLLAAFRRPLYGLFAILGLAGAGSLAWLLSDSLRLRFLHGTSGVYERQWMWESAIRMFRDRPLTGVGFSRTGEISPWYVKNVLHIATDFTSHAHNNVLDMLASTGLIGFGAFLAWWGFLFFASWKAFRAAPLEERWLPAAAFTGFAAFHVNGLTQVNYWDGKSEHALMLWAGVAVALWIRYAKRVGRKA